MSAKVPWCSTSETPRAWTNSNNRRLCTPRDVSPMNASVTGCAELSFGRVGRVAPSGSRSMGIPSVCLVRSRVTRFHTPSESCPCMKRVAPAALAGPWSRGRTFTCRSSSECVARTISSTLAEITVRRLHTAALGMPRYHIVPKLQEF